MMNFNDFLQICDEIELNKIASEVEMIMLVNHNMIDKYDTEMAQKKTFELMSFVNKLQDLKNKAMIHNAKKVFDMCEVYIVDAEYQMNLLRSKYMEV
jgi:hypothetical protein